jgi:hypothetical protein
VIDMISFFLSITPPSPHVRLLALEVLAPNILRIYVLELVGGWGLGLLNHTAVCGFVSVQGDGSYIPGELSTRRNARR